MNYATTAIIGGGIVGIAHALEAARQGDHVVMFERHPQPTGASIRNFGMIIPIAMPAGDLLQRALDSRAMWLALADKIGFWHDTSGSLWVAYQPDELAVLTEFVERSAERGYQCQLLSRDEVLARSGAVNPTNLLGGMWSQTEIVIDPREAIRRLHLYLQAEYGVQIRYNSTVTSIDLPHLTAGSQQWQAERAFVCGGTDFETLYPDTFQTSGLIRCKLHMLRTVTQPSEWQFGPMLATGLSMKRYGSFADCPTLPALKLRLDREYPLLAKWGIHLLACQNGLGEITLGDSHEYGWSVDPFNRAEIDILLLGHMRQLLNLPIWTLQHRWPGVYTEHPDRSEFIVQPAPNVTIVTGLGGSGMTLAFGLAKTVMG